MNVEDTGIRRVTDALREVTNPDDLQAIFVSNTTADALVPWLQLWLMPQIAEQRKAIENYVEPQFQVVNFLEWPTEELIATAYFVIGATETCAAMISKPSLVKFALELQKVVVACMAYRLMEAERVLASMASQSGLDSASPPS